MTKNDIIESLCTTAGLNKEQIQKAIDHKGNQLKEFYLWCYDVTEETNDKIAIAKYCLYRLCKLKF